MIRRFQIGGLLLLAAFPVLLPAQKGAAKAPPRPAAAAKAGKGQVPRFANPGNVVQQLIQMTPEERERALEKLPPQRQAQIRQRLQQFDSLPKQQQERRLAQLRQLASLSPETQALVRRQMQAFNQLPDDRKQVVGPEMQRLRRMSESERQARIASERFQNRFSPAEQQMMSDISGNMPLPPR